MSDSREIMKLIQEQHRELMQEVNNNKRSWLWNWSKRPHQIDGASKALADLACRIADLSLSKAQ